MGGIKLAWQTTYIDINLGYFHDISGVHNGNELHFNLGKKFAFKWGAVAFELGAVGKDAKLVNYYYQFTPAELGSLVPSMENRNSDTINYHTSAVINLPIWQSFNFVTMATYTWLGKGITNNPMVNKDSYLSGFIGVNYDF